MSDVRFRSNAVDDPRLAPYVASPQPAWLWSADGSCILWCNGAGATALGIDDPPSREKPLSPADPHRRQVAQLAPRLATDGAPRLERLRGFGARLGQLTTCACSRFAFGDGEAGTLVIALEVSIRVPPPMPPLAAAPAQEAGATIDAVARGAAVHAAPEAAAPAAEVQDLTRPDAPRTDPERARAGDTTAGKPLRFVWQIDATGSFSLTSDEFLRIAGERTALVQGRRWSEVTSALDLDAYSRINEAIAGRETFSGIAVDWPLSGDALGRVELSGMPIFDTAPSFSGYRGFGIFRPTALPSDPGPPQSNGGPIVPPEAEPSDHSTPATAAPAALESFPQRETDNVEPPQNVVPFPLANDTRLPSLSAVENHAFDEIARRLAQNFDDKLPEPVSEPPQGDAPAAREAAQSEHEASGRAGPQAWLAAPAVPPRGDSATDRMLLDLMPSGILIYRLDRLLYANRAFLVRTGYADLHALQEAGGLDALYVEPAPASASSASDDGMPLTISPSGSDGSPTDARLFSILWDGDPAHALILQEAKAAVPAAPATPSESPAQAAPAQAVDNAFDAILETATDGIILFDRSGAIVSANRSAEALFGIGAKEFRTLNFADLFATESQRVVLEYFESLDTPIAASPLDHGREVLGRERSGGFIPLSMTMGRLSDDRERFFAVFRDLSQLKKNETELLNARRKADRATAAKADALAGISHEIRGPLNTIIGFANIMIEERFGALGNERYAEYLKDIRASGERAVAILDDIVNISSIEAGNHDLRLVSQNLNEMVEQCVGVLQPQANRERVIIRTSLAHGLPQVMADTQALRQITMNIVTSSIRFSRAGGQVIVSTAAGDHGGAILRVRDTGRGLSDAELASAMSSHRTTSDRSAIDLSLARALAEANRAEFRIKTTENSGTLIEVAFANMRALAG